MERGEKTTGNRDRLLYKQDSPMSKSTLTLHGYTLLHTYTHDTYGYMANTHAHTHTTHTPHPLSHSHMLIAHVLKIALFNTLMEGRTFKISRTFVLHPVIDRLPTLPFQECALVQGCPHPHRYYLLPLPQLVD